MKMQSLSLNFKNAPKIEGHCHKEGTTSTTLKHFTLGHDSQGHKHK